MQTKEDKMTLLQSTVNGKYVGKTLLEYLTQRYPYRDKAGWIECIVNERIKLNDLPAKAEEKLSQGDQVSYWVELDEPEVNKDIQILHEDEQILVATKPPHLPSHADGNFIKNTFHFLLGEMMMAKGYKGRIWLVHRLDRETSGLIVVAKTKAALDSMMAQFARGSIKKEYRALVQGSVEKDRFEVRGWVGRDPASEITTKWAVVPEGTPGAKKAATEFEVIKRFKNTTLLSVFPKTGRTNQIRVHLAAVRHPVVGDKLYGRTDKEFLEYIRFVKAGGSPTFDNRLGAGRHLLHAYALTFVHPRTHDKLRFESPIPPDMEEIISRLKATAL